MLPVLAAISWPVIDRFRFGSTFAISPHGLGIAIGYLCGAILLTRIAPRWRVSQEHISTMIFWALVGALIGARVGYVIAHVSDFGSPLEWFEVWKGGISLLGGILGAVAINLPLMRKYGYRPFRVLDPAMIALAFGIPIGRIGDLVIGDHLGKPTSWALAFRYDGGNLAPPYVCRAGRCVADLLNGAHQIVVTHAGATLFDANGHVISRGIGVHQTALYDMISTTALFCVLWFVLARKPRRLGIITLTFGAWYGTTRFITDFLRIDKRFFGLTGSQWTAIAIATICLVTLIVWAIRGGGEPGMIGPGEEPEEGETRQVDEHAEDEQAAADEDATVPDEAATSVEPEP